MLKTKGGYTPKAGPKKREAKAERERIEQAVAKHSAPTRRVRSYHYKPRGKPKAKPPTVDLATMLREPKAPSEFDQFKRTLSADMRPFAVKLFQMQCEHPHEEVTENTSSFVNGVEPTFVTCKRCGLARKWSRSRKQMLMDEWTRYCPDGFDMFEWIDLIAKDKAMWPFLFDAAEESMLDDSMKGE